jgi:hypothetical protein
MPDLSKRFQRLDDVPVPDLRHDIEDRELRPASIPDAPSMRRRAIAGLVAFAVFAAAGIFAWSVFTPGSGDGNVAATTRVYRDSAGWTIHVPPGWSSLSFDLFDPSDGTRFHGVQLSNVELTTPVVGSGAPPQPNSSALPKNAVAVIVAQTSSLPGADEIPFPLSLDAFAEGSAPPGAPVFDVAYFAAGGSTFVSTVKIGAHADIDTTRRTVEQTVASFAYPQPSTPACVTSQLSARMAGSDGAAGTLFATIGLTNTSATACHLEGSPTVEMLDPSGTALAVQEQPGLPQGPSLEASTVVLQQDQEASFVVAFSDVNVGALPCLQVGSLRITPEGSSDALEVPLVPGGEVCDGTVWVAPFIASVPGP